MKRLIFIIVPLIMMLWMVGGCTAKEVVKPPIYYNPSIDTIPAVLIPPITPSQKDTVFIGTKIDTVYHDTTIIKYYPTNNQFVIQQTNNMLRYMDMIHDRINQIEGSIDSVKKSITVIASKEPEPYPFLKKLGWAFIGIAILLATVGVLGALLMFKK